ncbi:hypothetical protein K2P47_04920 [Patescibacteria group bacterium]|nr:hypothetical protein [Patescibacteria group bacterium]
MAAGSFFVNHPVNGKPVEIKAERLTSENVTVGQFLWYDGTTSMSWWSCPAIVTKVDNKKKTFQVMSLDDFVEQGSVYDFHVDENSDFSRQTMRVVSLEKVTEYLQVRQRKLSTEVSDAEQALILAKGRLEEFSKAVTKLNLKT